MPVRHARNAYRQSEIVKLMEKASWTSRNGDGSHIILSKAGRPTITLGPNIKDSTVIGLKKELGFHIAEVMQPQRGKRLKRDQIRDRIILAQKMRQAGFSAQYIMNNCKLSGLYSKGIQSEEIFNGEAEQLANKLYSITMSHKGVKVHLTPKPIVRIEDLSETPTQIADDETGVLLGLMSEIDRKLTEGLGPQGVLAPIYAERLRRTLADARILRQQLSSALEAADRIVSYLESS